MAPDPHDDQRGDQGDGVDPAELERLREEVAELRAAASSTDGGDRVEPGARRGPSCAGRSARWMVSVALVVLASLLTVVTVVARYVRSEVLDTDRYVETVSPLAGEPAVQDAVADQVTQEIVTRLDVESVAEDALGRLTQLGAPEVITGLAAPLADQVESFTQDHVDEFLRSDEFAQLWDDANRRAHDAVVAVLTGESTDAVSVDDGAVTIDLGVVVSRVRDRLVDRGLSLASNIPESRRRSRWSTRTSSRTPSAGSASSTTRRRSSRSWSWRWRRWRSWWRRTVAAPSWRWHSGWRCRWCCWRPPWRWSEPGT